MPDEFYVYLGFYVLIAILGFSYQEKEFLKTKFIKKSSKNSKKDDNDEEIEEETKDDEERPLIKKKNKK